MSWRNSYLPWDQASALVASRTGETGLLIAAFRSGQFAVRLASRTPSDLSFSDLADWSQTSDTPGSSENQTAVFTRDINLYGGGFTYVDQPHHSEATNLTPDMPDPDVETWLQHNGATVARGEIDRLWPANQGRQAPAPIDNRPPYARGRPPKWEWEDAIIELARIAYNGDAENFKRKDFISHLKSWFAKRHGGDYPHEKDITARVRKFVAEVIESD